MGFYMPMPPIDQTQMAKNFQKMQQQGNTLGQTLKLVELFSASSFGNSTIFGLGIMPYISASIILQLLGSVYPPLEKLQQEGEAGCNKVNEYTRYLTVGLCFLQIYMWVNYRAGYDHEKIIYQRINLMYPIF